MREKQRKQNEVVRAKHQVSIQITFHGISYVPLTLKTSLSDGGRR